jgi:uncharacterized protein with HEPN domain
VKDDRVYLQHIRDAIDDITTYTSAGRDAFFADRMQQDATLRKLEVIGQVRELSKSHRKIIGATCGINSRRMRSIAL